MLIFDKKGMVKYEIETETLSGANLYGADLSGADLSGANLSGADLSRANLSGADLSGANLSGADLSRANLSGADLSGADLSRANLSGSVFRECKIKNVEWPAPPMVLLANWGTVSDSLCLDLMVYDAFNHPEPSAFLRWNESAVCPYNRMKIERSARFVEKRSLIKPDFLSIKPKSAYALMQALLSEKCITS